MSHPFTHVELQTQDPVKAKTFYQSLFNWTFEEIPAMNYTLFNMGESTTGGMMKSAVPSSPSYWLAYVRVDDIRTAAQKAKGLGATIVQDALEVGEYGWLSVIVDPTGATLGLWQPKAGK